MIRFMSFRARCWPITHIYHRERAANASPLGLGLYGHVSAAVKAVMCEFFQTKHTNRLRDRAYNQTAVGFFKTRCLCDWTKKTASQAQPNVRLCTYSKVRVPNSVRQSKSRWLGNNNKKQTQTRSNIKTCTTESTHARFSASKSKQRDME